MDRVWSTVCNSGCKLTASSRPGKRWALHWYVTELWEGNEFDLWPLMAWTITPPTSMTWHYTDHILTHCNFCASVEKLFTNNLFNPFSPPFLLTVAKMSLPWRSAPYWSNPPFQFFDIRALWHSGLSARVPKCQKIIKCGLDQNGPEHYEV